MKSYIRSAVIALMLNTVSASAWAAGDSGGGAMPAWGPSDPVLERFGQATSRKDWEAAAGIAREALGRTPGNANYHNLYAYAVRKSAKPSMDLVFKHYNEALRIEPEHRGAHEYLGEAYLMVGNLAKAKEHLAALDRICTFGCEEFSMLRKAIAEYEAKKK